MPENKKKKEKKKMSDIMPTRGEKAKDMKGTIIKMFRYMGKYKVLLAFIFIFAVCGTLFSIVGPKILGMATTDFTIHPWALCSQWVVYRYSELYDGGCLSENDVSVP